MDMWQWICFRSGFSDSCESCLKGSFDAGLLFFCISLISETQTVCWYHSSYLLLFCSCFCCPLKSNSLLLWNGLRYLKGCAFKLLVFKCCTCAHTARCACMYHGGNGITASFVDSGDLVAQSHKALPPRFQTKEKEEPEQWTDNGLRIFVFCCSWFVIGL